MNVDDPGVDQTVELILTAKLIITKGLTTDQITRAFFKGEHQLAEEFNITGGIGDSMILQTLLGSGGGNYVARYAYPAIANLVRQVDLTVPQTIQPVLSKVHLSMAYVTGWRSYENAPYQSYIPLAGGDTAEIAASVHSQMCDKYSTISYESAGPEAWELVSVTEIAKSRCLVIIFRSEGGEDIIVYNVRYSP